MNKKLAAVLLAGALLFGAAPLQAQESSSIDAVTAGVADTCLLYTSDAADE